jgi:hypothetical protein
MLRFQNPDEMAVSHRVEIWLEKSNEEVGTLRHEAVMGSDLSPSFCLNEHHQVEEMHTSLLSYFNTDLFLKQSV